jgi:replicative DNA helicase Mcm
MRDFNAKPVKPAIEPQLLRKYIAYARAKCHPKLTRRAGQRLKEFYLQMRERAGEAAPISITLRQYEALIRLAEASAKVRLSSKVDVSDAERAIRLMRASLRQFGFEPETGEIDIDRAEGQKVTTAQRSKIRVVLDLIDELSLVYGKNVPLQELISRAREAGVDGVEGILRKMQREGIVFSPKVGFLRKV